MRSGCPKSSHGCSWDVKKQKCHSRECSVTVHYTRGLRWLAVMVFIDSVKANCVEVKVSVNNCNHVLWHYNYYFWQLCVPKVTMFKLLLYLCTISSFGDSYWLYQKRQRDNTFRGSDQMKWRINGWKQHKGFIHWYCNCLFLFFFLETNTCVFTTVFSNLIFLTFLFFFLINLPMLATRFH